MRINLHKSAVAIYCSLFLSIKLVASSIEISGTYEYGHEFNADTVLVVGNCNFTSITLEPGTFILFQGDYTSNLFIPSLAEIDTGYYRAIINNLTDTVWSNPIHLTSAVTLVLPIIHRKWKQVETKLLNFHWLRSPSLNRSIHGLVTMAFAKIHEHN